jgi:CubicO group peptidase (beta-lactamase class C family)
MLLLSSEFCLLHSTLDHQDYPYITRMLQRAIENGSTPGIALLVGKDGTLLYRYAVGQAQIYPEAKELKEDTIFDIASLTKVVATTTAIMLLLRDHRLKLDDPLQHYFPEFAQPVKEQLTIKHLLIHSAGLPDHIPFYELVQQEAERQGTDFIGSPAAKQFVLEKICQTDLIYPPGQQYKYSDLGFILLGQIIENISGMAFDRYCHDLIFAPLQMSRTFFRRHGEPLPEGEYAATERCEWRHRIVCGEVHDENAYAMGGVAGHAGLFSTLDDLHKFMCALYRCYKGSDSFIPKPIVHQFFSRQNLPEYSTRALGWDTPSDKDSSSGTLLSKKSVGHTGFTGTSLWFDPQRKLHIILLANRVHPSRNNQRFLKMRSQIHDTVVIAVDRE